MAGSKDDESGIIGILQTTDLSDEERANGVASLYSRYFPGLMKYLLQLGASLEDAEDIAHDVLIKVLYTKIQSFENRAGSTFKAWLYTITRNEYFNLHKENRKSQSLDALENDSDLFGQGAALNAVDLQDYLASMIEVAKLTALEAQVIRLSAYFDLKPSEIAEIIPRQSSAKVSRILYNARQKIANLSSQ